MTARADGPRIVVDNGEYWLQNKGDLAMLAVTCARLRERWPAARIGVVTFDPVLLPLYERAAEPLFFSDGGAWRGVGPLAAAAARLPAPAAGRAVTWGRRTARRPRAVARMLRDALRRTPAGPVGAADAPWPAGRPRPRVPRAVEDADLVLGLGGGYLTDVDRNQAHRTLDLLERATQLGVPTALLGQGMGPLDDAVLRERAAAVLPSVCLVAVREPVTGPRLLAELGVPADRVVVTGDDAVELALRAAPARPGDGLGICLRTAEYSPVPGSATAALRDAVQQAARAQGAPLVPLAVSTYRDEDARSAAALVAGHADVVRPLDRYASAADLVRRVGRCRVVVTGAYHAGVFALSQGVPVVALTSSRYYDDKFAGLTAMFGGTGIVTLRLDDPQLRDRVAAELRRLWQEAPGLAEPLRAAAARQVSLGRAAYERVYDLVDARVPV